MRAEDHVAEDEFRDAQENYSVGDPHAEYHAAGTLPFASACAPPAYPTEGAHSSACCCMGAFNIALLM